jgi:Tol biopolymer transport system component
MKHAKNLFVVVALMSFGFGMTSAPAGALDPPVNGRIAFERYDPVADESHAFTVNPDGTGENQLVPEPAQIPRWSPDGTKISIYINGSNTATVNPDGSGEAMIAPANGPPHLMCWAWSPDGVRLACTGWDDNDQSVDGVYTVRATDGGKIKRITTYPYQTPDGQWQDDIPLGYSADGSRILIDRNGDGDLGHLVVVNANGTGLHQIDPPNLLVGCCSPADWSPDGTRVAFAAWKLSAAQGRTDSALFVVNENGTGLRQISPSGARAHNPSWSPDGQMIAFNSEYPSGPQIYVVHPDRSGFSELTVPTDGSIGYAPTWSPDSSTLLFIRRDRSGQQDLWTVERDGSGLFRLTNTPLPTGVTEHDWGMAPLP